ncbi:MAG: DUF421 domain-containing protein [Gemmatimonadota bacterium]
METVLRVAFVYVLLVVALRILGKREFAQLSPFELVTLLIIPEIVSQSLLREDHSLTNAVVGVSTLLSLVFATSLVSYLSKPVEKVLAGEPAVLVRHGFLVPRSMAVERVPPQEILSEMHKVGLETLAELKWGILETDGTITFVPWERPQPVKARSRKGVQ